GGAAGGRRVGGEEARPRRGVRAGARGARRNRGGRHAGGRQPGGAGGAPDVGGGEQGIDGEGGYIGAHVIATAGSEPGRSGGSESDQKTAHIGYREWGIGNRESGIGNRESGNDPLSLYACDGRIAVIQDRGDNGRSNRRL